MEQELPNGSWWATTGVRGCFRASDHGPVSFRSVGQSVDRRLSPDVDESRGPKSIGSVLARPRLILYACAERRPEPYSTLGPQLRRLR